MFKSESKKQKLNFKKVNLAIWGGEQVDFGEEEKEEEALLSLMTLKDEENEIYNQTLCSSNDDEIDNLYNELYESLFRAKKELNHINNKNESLIEKFS